MSPTNDRRASRTPSSLRPSTGLVSSTRPAASCVSVTWPKRTVASYSFSPSAMNPAILVAAPTQIGKTPVAVGSSVPVCPTRFDLKRPFTRRTTSNEVGPLGLLTTTTPLTSGIGGPQGLRHLRRDPRANGRVVSLDRASRGVLVPSSAELLRDSGDVDVSARAEADAPGATARFRLAQGRGHFDAV